MEEDKLSTSEESAFGLAQGRQLTNLELIKKADEYTDTLKLEKAVALYEEGLQRFPNDTLILDGYSDLLIQLGEEEKAKKLIERSVQLNPNSDGRKYLNLAEMMEGLDSVQLYRKGVEVLKKDLHQYKISGMKEEYNLTQKQISSALASIAEAYMHEPLWYYHHIFINVNCNSDDPKAENECESCLKEALKIDNENIDALQTMANLRVIRAKDNEAIECLKRVVKILTESKIITRIHNQLIEEQPDLPSIDFRMITSRLLIELQQFKDAIKVLDTVVQENDEQPEAWYLLAFSYFNLKKYQNAKECSKNVKTIAAKLKLDDMELKQGNDELWNGILKALGKKEDSDDEMEEGGEDDSYDTVSQEDISGDEQDDHEMKD